MKKVVVFTHGIDIDGFGCAVLANLAFENAEIVFADNFNLDEKFIQFDKENDLKSYDEIYITDHCLSFDLCKEIERNSELLSKIKIFDHHVSRLNEQGSLPWITLKVENEKGKCSGTSLFYEYLVENNYISANESLDIFVNLTRLYDTWEWVNNPQGQQAYRLNTLFQAVGRGEYISILTKKLAQNSIEFTCEENAIIDKYLENFQNQIKEYVSKLKLLEIDNLRVGFVEIQDLYKNDISKMIIENGNPDNLDCLMMPIVDRSSVSLRNVKSNCDVSILAKSFGGSGHKGAASFPKEALSNVLNQEKNV